MALPLLLLSMGLSAGSALANSAANNAVSGARNKVFGDERTRQNALDAEIGALNTGARARYAGFGGQMADTGVGLGDYLKTRVTDAPGMMPGGDNLVASELAKARAGAQAFTDQQSGARADMRSFGDLLGQISRGQSRDIGQIAQLGGFKRGSAGIVPVELDQASHAGDNMKLLADLLGGAANITGSMNAGNISKTGGSQIAQMFGLGG